MTGELSLTTIPFVQEPDASWQMKHHDAPVLHSARTVRYNKGPGALNVNHITDSPVPGGSTSTAIHPATLFHSVMRDCGRRFKNFIVDLLFAVNDPLKIKIFPNLYPCYLIHLNTYYYFYL